MKMVYFKNESGEVYGYDSEDDNATIFIAAAENAGWENITESWPLQPSLNDTKIIKLAELNVTIYDVLARGYLTSLGIKMDATLEALQTLKTGYDFAKLMGDLVMTIVDYNDQQHPDLLLADVEKIMKEVYANYRNLFLQKQVLRGEIAAAINVADLDKVNWPA